MLNILVPIAALVRVGLTDVVRLPGNDRLGYVVPGVLKRLGGSPLTRRGLLTAKTVAVLVVIIIQIALLSVVGLLLGWGPDQGQLLPALALLLLATAVVSSSGLLLAGTLPAQATAGAATLAYLVLLVVGGVMFPAPQPRGSPGHCH